MREYIVDFPSNEINDLVMHERIVRCRDCEEFKPYPTYAGMELDYGKCMEHERETNADRFCWWGGRNNEQLKMANVLLRKSEAAKIERIEQLESLIRDMWREMITCPEYATPPCMMPSICEQIRNLEIEMN